MMQNLYTVSKVFAGRLFRVPDYQRGYSWGKQQCQDLVEDLDLLGEGKEHFMGLLILHDRDGESAKVLDQKGNAYETFDVVDGQQRLTTLVVFLHALQKEMRKYDSRRMLAEGLDESYLATRNMSGQPLCKLTLNRDTHGFFYGTILERSPDIQGPTNRSHQFLAGAKEYFTAYLDAKRGALGDSFPEWLKAQYLKVTQQLTLVVYTVRSEADAGVVFETMNNRGKPLTELEKVKNYLLYLASKLELPCEHDLARDINDTWTHIFERLMAADLGEVENEDQLLRTHWLMEHDYDRNKPVSIRSIKKRFALGSYRGKHPDLLDQVKAYLASLRNAAVAYCDIYRPRHSSAYGPFKAERQLHDRLIAAGERLARLGAPVTFVPLLMAVRIKYPDDGERCLKALELCERFNFRVYRWMERPAYTGQSWIFRLGYQIYHGRDLDGVLDELRGAILYYCPDQRIPARFEERDLNWFAWPGLKYMLYEYEQHLADGAGQAVRMPWEDLARKQDTVEHILPQAMDSGGYWAQRFAPEEHARWVHDIGNLTLTFDNSCLGNKPFPEKKGAAGRPCCYASSKLFVEQAIARYEDWTPDTIQARRREIEGWVGERWRVEPGGAPVSDKAGDGTALIQRVLTRTFVPRGQLLLYRALYEAGDEFVPYRELHERMGVDDNQLHGILGGLGNRINLTEGVKPAKPGVGLLLEVRRSGIDWGWALRPELVAVLEGMPGFRAVLAGWSTDEITERYRQVWDKDWGAQRRDLGLDG
ncbi:MAG TPA: DUF262 domain-containing HNH endonuclease family protein [Anaerolineae bacterium]|nr:DUF262 domain-containing HNH endonuclease family protein [Anaerolineae bacterium]